MFVSETALCGWADSIQTGFPAEAARLCRKGAAYAFRGVDSLALSFGKDLHKRCFCCSCERKYFSPASLVKISDKVHPAAGLGDMEILAVKHLPFLSLIHI